MVFVEGMFLLFFHFLLLCLRWLGECFVASTIGKVENRCQSFAGLFELFSVEVAGHD